MNARWAETRRRVGGFGWDGDHRAWHDLADAVESTILEVVQAAVADGPDRFHRLLLDDLAEDLARIEQHTPVERPGASSAAREARLLCAAAALVVALAGVRTDGADADRVLRHLGDLAGLAGIATPLACGLDTLEEPGLLSLPQLVSTLLATAWPDDAESRAGVELRLGRCHVLLRPASAAAWTVAVAVVDVTGSGPGADGTTGNLLHFTFEPWRSLPGSVLVRSGMLGGVLLANEVVEAVQLEWRRSAAPAGTWQLDVADDSARPGIGVVEGTSLAGAVRIAFEAARRRLPLDPTVLVVAGVDEDDPARLTPMPSSLRAKMDAWRAGRPGRRVVLGPGADNRQVRDAQGVLTMATVDAALDIASYGVASAVARHLAGESGPTAEVFAELDRIQHGTTLRGTTVPYSRPLLELVDQDAARTRTITVAELAEALADRSPDTCRRYLITAEPGEGKSTLAKDLARILGTLHPHSSRVPAIVGAEEVVRHGITGAVRRLLAGTTGNESAATQLAAAGDDLVVLVDGLDQVRPDGDLERMIVDWPGPLVLLGRPEIKRFGLPEVHLRIRPLTRSQAVSLFAQVSAALADDDPEEHLSMARRVVRHPAAAPLAGNPMLVTLLAWWVTQEGRVDTLPPSSRLYHDLFRAMVATSDRPVPEARIDLILDTFGIAIARHRRENPHDSPRAPLPIADIREQVRDVRGCPPDIDIVDALVASRLLYAADGDLHALHPSFLESLGARGLAVDLRRSAREDQTVSVLVERDIDRWAGRQDWDLVLAHAWGLVPAGVVLPAGTGAVRLRDGLLALITGDREPGSPIQPMALDPGVIPGRDDVWLSRHGTALACIAQQEGTDDSGVVLAIVERTWSYWWSFARRGVAGFLADLRPRLSVIGLGDLRRAIVAASVDEPHDDLDRPPPVGRILLGAGIPPGDDLGDLALPVLDEHPQDADVLAELVEAGHLPPARARDLVGSALDACTDPSDAASLTAALFRVDPTAPDVTALIRRHPGLAAAVLARLVHDDDAAAAWTTAAVATTLPENELAAVMATLAAGDRRPGSELPLAALRAAVDPERCSLGLLLDLWRVHAAVDGPQAHSTGVLRHRLTERVLAASEPSELDIEWRPEDLDTDVVDHLQAVLASALETGRSITASVSIAHRLDAAGVSLNARSLDALAELESRSPTGHRRAGSLVFDARPEATSPSTRAALARDVPVPRLVLSALADLASAGDADPLADAMARWSSVAESSWRQPVRLLAGALGADAGFPDDAIDDVALPAKLCAVVRAVEQAAARRGQRLGTSPARDLTQALDRSHPDARRAALLLIIGGRAVPPELARDPTVSSGWRRWAGGQLAPDLLATAVRAARASGLAVPDEVVARLESSPYRTVVIDLLPADRRARLAPELVGRLRDGEVQAAIGHELDELRRASK